ncbi:putative ribonuclease H-like domain-containing protein [Tanacetum coccineum]|uniref:Ribonuclease H-like domain-containing protein n=1 Tax=Tanacetum coccineum TaxID=301880 RepID=A0ABQ5EY69_9ASTR
MPSNHSKNNETLKVNRKVWNDMINEKQGNGYSFTKKNGFVCGSLNHLIKDCDYYEKKIAREAEEHPLKNMVNRGIFANSGCQGAHDSNRFSWVFFLASKDETSGILQNFIRQIENQLSHRVKIIRSDNGTEFKNRDMLEFCGNKGIKQEYSNARTPQQNGVAERMNRTLIEAARTMLVDSLLPTTFWAEAVKTACYIFNRVRVTKPQNKTPYELLFGHKPIISYIRPFGCHVTILDTLSVLGKFDGKSDEGFLVGYSLNSKAYRVYNLVTKRVEVNLHVNFLEDKPNVKGVGYRWMFDIDYLTDSMNYIPVSLENQANPHAGTSQTPNSNASEEKDEDIELIVVPSAARTTLLQSIPDDHMADFHYMDDARDIWNAVKARFGRNAKSKKMRKSMLKQEFSEFRIGDAGEFALMGVTSEVHNCPFGCDNKYNELQKQYNELNEQNSEYFIQVQAYKNSLKTLEKQKRVLQKNQLTLEDKIRVLSIELENTTNLLKHSERINAIAETAKKDLQTKLDNHLVQTEKWRTSSKNLFRLVDSSMSVRTKVGLGFTNYIGENELGWDDSAFSVFTTNSKEVEDHTDLDESQMSYGTKSSTSGDSNSVSNDFVSCDNSDKSSEVNSNDFASSDSSVKSSEPKSNDSTSCASTSSISTSESEAEIESNVGTPIQETINVQDLPSFSCNSSDKNGNTSRTSCNKNGYINKKAGHFRKNASSVSKLCFVCGSSTHLIKDCDFYEKQMANKTVGNGVGPVHSRNNVNHQNQYVPHAVLLRTRKVNITPARPQPVPTGKPKVPTPVPTGRQNRPIPVPTGRVDSPSVTSGWWKSTARPMPHLNRPTSSYFQTYTPYVPQVYSNHMQYGGVRWATAVKPSAAEVVPKSVAGLSFSAASSKLLSFDVQVQSFMCSSQDSSRLDVAVKFIFQSSRYVVPTGRVVVPTGRYIVPAGKVIIIVSTGRLSLVPTGRVLSPGSKDLSRVGSNKWYQSLLRVSHKKNIPGFKILINLPQQEKTVSFTDTLEDNPKIQAFRRELEEIALKHLGTVTENNTTSTPLVNTGSQIVNTGRLDPDDSPMPELKIFHKSETGIFDEASYDEDGVITDFNSLPIEIEVSPTPTLRIHNIHPKSQILGDPKSVVQTRSKEPKKIVEALQDDSWVQAMQEELLQFRLQQVWVLIDLPHGMKVIGTNWVYINKRDERGVVVRNKARLVAQGYTQEEGNTYSNAYFLNTYDDNELAQDVCLLLGNKAIKSTHVAEVVPKSVAGSGFTADLLQR